MSREERITESILLSQRWRLITDGVLRANIRIRGKSLYVNKKIHGTVTNSVYVRLAVEDSPPPTPEGTGSPLPQTEEGRNQLPTDHHSESGDESQSSN